MNKRLISGMLALAFFNVFAIRSFAFDEPNILEYRSNANSEIITVYANDIGSGDISCRIAGYDCSVEAKNNIYSSDDKYKTLFIVDSSKSMSVYGDSISEFLLECVDKKKDNEYFSFAIFGGTSAKSVTGYESNQYNLVKAVENITYNSESSYIFDNVNNAVKDLANDEDDCYERIVLFTDGCENSAKGITIDDLEKTITANPIQIYTVTFVDKDKSNYEKLKTVARMARTSGGSDIQISSNTDVKQSARVLFDDAESITAIDIRIDAAAADGSRKAIELTSGDAAIRSEIIVPMLSNSAQGQPDDTTTYTETEEIAATLTAAAAEQPIKASNDDSSDKTLIIAVLAGAAVIAIIIAAVIIVSRNKKNTATPAAATSYKPAANNDVTEIISDKKGDTAILPYNDEPNSGPSQIILRDKISSRTFEASLSSAVVIGRSSDESSLVIDYDKSISKRHCKIYKNGGRVYIEDLGSSNKTFVNEVMISSTHVLSSGDEIKIGRVKFTVTIS